MKCKHCDGTGTTNWCVNGTFLNCPHCGGIGEVEMTNEEWFCGLSTEEKAGFLDAINTSYCVTGDWLHDEDVHGMKRKDWQEWLKQPHKG